MRQDEEVTPYVRPSIDAPVFRDRDGRVIEYGSRWVGSPPENTYSVDTHPARFAPLHIVATALIAYLTGTFDVEVEDSVETAHDLLLPPFHHVLRSVRIRPNDEACSSLTLVFTAYPGIYTHAGLLNDFHYPVCGCDACDSNWVSEADDLERQVLAVAEGRYQESIDHGARPWVANMFTYLDERGRSGRSLAQDIDEARRSGETYPP